MRYRGFALLACLLIHGVPAHAQDQSVAFSIGDREFTMAVPEGYCLPEGHLVQAAADIAEADASNFTLAHFYGCDEQMIYTDRWILVKTARNTVGWTYPDRERWLDAWQEHFEQRDGSSVDEEIVEIAEQATTPVLGDRPEIDLRISYGGRDANCVYSHGGGTVTLGIVTQNIRDADALCIVGSKSLSIHAYDSRQGANEVEVLELVHEVFRAIVPVD